MRTTNQTVAVAAAVFALAAAGCAPPAEEEPVPPGETSVNIGWSQPFYSYNGDTVTGDAPANSNVLYLLNGGFNYYDADLELVQDESFGTYEKTSDDPLTVRYRVEEDVRWSDGTPVDAADLLLQWAALSGALNTAPDEGVSRDPDTGVALGAPAGTVYFDARTPGLDLVTRTPEIGDDGRSITLVYDEPFADWEHVFDIGVPGHATAMRALDIDDPEEAKEALVEAIQDEDGTDLSKIADFWNRGFDYAAFPADDLLRLSSGAYLMRAFEENQHMTLEANPRYRGGRKAAVDKVTIRWYEDPLAQVQALRNGELDLVSAPSTPDVLQAAEAIAGATVETGALSTYEHVDLTHDNRGPFDPRTYRGDEEKARAVRLAFLKTIPRQEIVDTLVEPLHEAAEVRSSQTIAPGAPGYDEMVARNGSDEFDRVDLEGARRLLRRAGVKTPVTVRFLFDADNPRREDTFELIRRSAKDAGFDVVDRSDPDWGLLLGGGTYDAAQLGSPTTSTAVTESEPRFTSNGAGNYGGFESAQVDRLYDELRATTDPDRRLEIQIAVEERLWADGFGVPLHQAPGLTAYSRNISDVQPIMFEPTVFHGFWEWEPGGGRS